MQLFFFFFFCYNITHVYVWAPAALINMYADTLPVERRVAVIDPIANIRPAQSIKENKHGALPQRRETCPLCQPMLKINRKCK